MISKESPRRDGDAHLRGAGTRERGLLPAPVVRGAREVEDGEGGVGHGTDKPYSAG